jgi:heme O synthase-like polyprenyltransferase
LPAAAIDNALQIGLARRSGQALRDYAELTKPKVQSLLLLTTVTTMLVAGHPSVALIALTCLGGYLSAEARARSTTGSIATSTPRCAARPTAQSPRDACRRARR